MPKKNMFVRGMDEDVLLEFKSKATLQKKTLREAVNEAIKMWIAVYG